MSTNGTPIPVNRSAFSEDTAGDAEADRLVLEVKGTAGGRRLAVAEYTIAEKRGRNQHLSHRLGFAYDVGECLSRSADGVQCDWCDEGAQEGQHDHERRGSRSAVFLLKHEFANKCFELLPPWFFNVTV
jgi:hypothetical protein